MCYIIINVFEKGVIKLSADIIIYSNRKSFKALLAGQSKQRNDRAGLGNNISLVFNVSIAGFFIGIIVWEMLNLFKISTNFYFYASIVLLYP